MLASLLARQILWLQCTIFISAEPGKSSPCVPVNQQSLTRQQLAEELYGDVS